MTFKNNQKIVFYILGFLLIVSLFYVTPTLTGYVVGDSKSYAVDEQFTSSGVYLWHPGEGEIVTDLKIDGKVYGEGNVEVSVIKDGLKTVLFNRHIEKKVVNVEDYVALAEGTDIGLTLDYGTGGWDTDNNGLASYDGGIDFKLKPLMFSRFNDDNLCTLWEVYSIDNQDYESTCYGSDICCSYTGFESLNDDWDEDFVLVKGDFGSTASNIVLARVIYYNRTHVSYSNYDGLTAKFSNMGSFKNFSGDQEGIYNSSNYLFKVDVDKDTIFHFRSINYAVKIFEDDNRSIIKEENNNISINQTKKPDKNGLITKFTIDGNNEELDYEVIYKNNTFIQIDLLQENTTSGWIEFKLLEDLLINSHVKIEQDNYTIQPEFLRVGKDSFYYRAKVRMADFDMIIFEQSQLTKEKEDFSPFNSYKYYFIFFGSIFLAFLIFLIGSLDDTVYSDLDLLKSRLESKWLNFQMKILGRKYK